MAESDPNADAVLARIEAALARVAALAAQKNDMALAAQKNDAALAAQRDAASQGAHKDTAALAAGLDRVIARLRAALAETGG
jgi:hypothetical protein